MSGKGLFVTQFVVPKAGATPDECEDALCVLPHTSFDTLLEGTVAAAVCDGATESLLSGEWAGILASEAANSAGRANGLFSSTTQFEEFTVDVVNQWQDWLRKYTDQRVDSGRPLRWYEEAKLVAGAHSTLLAAVLVPDAESEHGQWSWQAAGLGDSCLFHVREGRVLTAHPVSAVEDFGNQPELFASSSREPELLARRTRFAHGTCVSGDTMLLTTDAMAAWFLAQPEPIQAVEKLTDYARNPSQEEPFEAWVQDLRDRGALRNDDVALVHIEAQGQ